MPWHTHNTCDRLPNNHGFHFMPCNSWISSTFGTWLTMIWIVWIFRSEILQTVFTGRQYAKSWVSVCIAANGTKNFKRQKFLEFSDISDYLKCGKGEMFQLNFSRCCFIHPPVIIWNPETNVLKFSTGSGTNRPKYEANPSKILWNINVANHSSRVTCRVAAATPNTLIIVKTRVNDRRSTKYNVIP